MIGLMIVDDDPVVVDLISAIFDDEDDISVVATSTSGTAAFLEMSKCAVDVILADVRMPGMSGAVFTKEVCRRAPHIPVVGISAYDEDSSLVGMLRAGASGFVLKSSPRSTMTMAIRHACDGKTVISSDVAGRLVRHLRPTVNARVPVTSREREVLDLLGEGMSNAEIAEELNVSLSTVKKHITNLMAAYGVTSRLKLIVRVLKDIDAEHQ